MTYLGISAFNHCSSLTSV
ncbi:hypothetical protein, partial [Flavobacterium psychrophilum]